ncbi:uncharacterized protein UBRO_20340 [Ustilago bromivora]|uniref:CCHC-type domain-containing protein n=1 Tax=Ustilago bromivora TaxID=307758 RepID=A0A1K0HD12_9BASI|nr:uncharacterized protein UBRO_20340 [Ustilago bromivora]
MSKVNYSIYNSFAATVQDLLPQLPRMVQDHFNHVMEDEVYGMPNAPKDGQLLEFIVNDDGEQTISPLTILAEQMQTRVNLFVANKEWDASHILDLKIEGLLESTCDNEQHNHPMKVDTSTSIGGDPPASNSDVSNQHLVSHGATLGPTPKLNMLTNHHLKVLSGLNDKMRWDDQDLLDPSSIVMCSFSDRLHTEYFTEHGDQPVPITVDLFNWVVDKCTVHSIAKEYELLASAYALHWNQVGRHAYDFLIKWEAHVSELHTYLKTPWMPDHRYRTLKHALPSDRNTLFNSVFILHEQLHGREQTAESVANVLCRCYELAAESVPVNQHHATEESELTALRAATLINCWACGELGHAANRCPNDAAHARWKEGKVKAPPKSHANTCIVLPLEITQEE